MSNLTAAEVTNWYLYGRRDTPTNLADESLIRSSNSVVSVEQDVISYMTTGAGRFAIGSKFAVVSRFLERDPSTGAYLYNFESNKTYTQRDIADLTGLNTHEFSFLLTFRERDVDDGAGDYAERTYIWNTVAFQIRSAFKPLSRS